MQRCAFSILLLVFGSMVAAQPYFPVKVNKKWGLIDADGQLILAPDYDAIGEFKHFGYAVMQRQGRVGLLGPSGQEAIAPLYDDLKMLDSTLIAVMEEGRWKVINLYGKTVLEKGYEQVQVWDSYYLAYRQGGKWGLVNKFGHQLAGPEYDAIQHEPGGFFITNKGSQLGLLSSTGRPILPNKAQEIRFFSDSLFFFRAGNHWGAVDLYGIEIIPPKYHAFSRISNDFIKLAASDGLHLYSQACGRIISKGQYEDYYAFSRRYLIVKKQRQLGLIDWCGGVVLPVAYQEIQPYEDKLFRVNQQGKWGVVEAGGKTVIPFRYDYIAPLNQSVCVVKQDGLLGLVNRRGEEVASPGFQRIELKNNFARAYRSKGGGSREEVLSVMRFDEEGRLVDTSSFTRHFQVSIGGAGAPASVAQSSEYQLEQFEWFYAPQEDRWGLRRLDDGSVQIEPKFHSIRVEQGSGFTLVGIEKSERYEFERTTFRFDMAYGLVSNELGVLVTEMEFWDIRFEDFHQGNPLARCIFTNGRHGLVNRIGRVVRRDLAYVGEFNDGLARFSPYGRLSGSMKDYRSLGKLRTYTNAIAAPGIMVDYTQYDQVFRNEAWLVCENCEWGYIDTAGQAAVPPRYTFAKEFINNVGIVECAGKWGAVNRRGEMVLPCAYDEIQFLENTDNSIIQVYRQQPKYGLIDTLGQLTVHTVYDEIGSFSEGRLAVKRNGLWGFADRDGLEVIPCRFREVQNFSESLAAVKLGSGWGFIDKQGHVEVDFTFKKVGDFKHGLAWATAGEGVGYIDPTGEFAIPARYEKAHDFDGGIARVVKGGEYGLIGINGQFLLRPRFAEIKAFNEYGLAVARPSKNNLRYSLINRQGELVGKLQFKEIQPFSEGFAAVKLKEHYGYVDLAGKLVIPDIYTQASAFSEGLAAVQKDGACGYINPRGEQVIPLEYSKCLDFNAGRAVVYKGIRKAGLLDREGKLLIEPGLDRLLNFQEGRGLVRDEKYRFYYITEQAHSYHAYYQEATEFKHGVAVVQVNGKWGIINQKGIEIIPPKYDKIESFQDGYAKVRIQGFRGLASLNGELIVQPDYEYISYAGEGLFRVEQGDMVGYFDRDGQWVWDLSK
jgi:hypothetical protein